MTSASSSTQVRVIAVHPAPARTRPFVVALLLAGFLMIVSVVARAAPDINQKGLTGAWADPATPAQGLMLEIYPDFIEQGTGYLIGTWYTYDTEPGGADRNRWYSFQDVVQQGTTSASMTIYSTVGGVFDAPSSVSTTVVGSAIIRFDSCTAGRFDYVLDDGRAGSIPLARVMPSGPCDDGGGITPFDRDFALSGNWIDVSTTAQGLVVEVNPLAAQVLVGWYTFDDSHARDASSQRWFTARGSYKPHQRDMDLEIYESVGGTFSGNGGVQTTLVGAGHLRYTSCTEAYFTYAFKSGSLAGRSRTMTLSRIGAPPTICPP